jgi:murein DD-endopeptidase MepM/ murein hydrolase activator NlpD
VAVLALWSRIDLKDEPASSSTVPAAVPQLPESDPVTVRKTGIPRGATLATVLREFDVSGSEIHRLVEDTRPVYNLDRVRPGNRLVLEQELDGSFRSVRYDIDEEEYLVVRQERDRYVATRHKYDFQLEEERVFGEIRTSLTEALISQGEKYALVFKVLDILGWDLDFTQLQPQDSFTLLVEKKYRAGRFVKYGDVLAVRFDQMDRSLFGFLFTDPATGKEDYFDEKGNSLRKAFLRVPFKFDPRITSGFSYSRYHPVLKRRRPHLGVDYGAPTGTEVLSVAAGTVSFAGRNGGYGKMVRIRHVKFSTSYAHLSRIQVRRGQRVEQGDVVGRVGSTGLSTGPHLDYRIQDRSGRYLNPAKLKFPPEKPVAPQHLDAFRGARNDLMQRLSLFPANAEYFTRKAKSG